MRIPTRAVFGAIFVISASLIAAAIFYFQEELGLDPCPMCILSRYCFVVIGIVSLAATVHGPKGAFLKGYGILVALLAVTGIGISIRHSYLQHFPPALETCGTDLAFLMNTLPLSQALPKIFQGTGTCSSVDWKMLGMSLPEWALVWFLIFGAGALWVAFRKSQ